MGVLINGRNLVESIQNSSLKVYGGKTHNLSNGDIPTSHLMIQNNGHRQVYTQEDIGWDYGIEDIVSYTPNYEHSSESPKRCMEVENHLYEWRVADAFVPICPYLKIPYSFIDSLRDAHCQEYPSQILRYITLHLDWEGWIWYDLKWNKFDVYNGEGVAYGVELSDQLNYTDELSGGFTGIGYPCDYNHYNIAYDEYYNNNFYSYKRSYESCYRYNKIHNKYSDNGEILSYTGDQNVLGSTTYNNEYEYIKFYSQFFDLYYGYPIFLHCNLIGIEWGWKYPNFGTGSIHFERFKNNANTNYITLSSQPMYYIFRRGDNNFIYSRKYVYASLDNGHIGYFNLNGSTYYVNMTNAPQHQDSGYLNMPQISTEWNNGSNVYEYATPVPLNELQDLYITTY